MRRSEPIDMPIARLLRQKRHEAGVPLATIAKRADVSINTVSALERGTRSTRAVGTAMAYRLAQALGVAPARLMLAMGTGNPEAVHASDTPSDTTSVPIVELPANHKFEWNPWTAAPTEIRYPLARHVTAGTPVGALIRWSAGAPAPLVSVAARSYLGRMAPGWVAYLLPTPTNPTSSEQEKLSEALDSNPGLILLGWPRNLALVTASDLWSHLHYDADYELEGTQRSNPQKQRIIGQLAWWAPQ